MNKRIVIVYYYILGRTSRVIDIKTLLGAAVKCFAYMLFGINGLQVQITVTMLSRKTVPRFEFHMIVDYLNRLGIDTLQGVAMDKQKEEKPQSGARKLTTGIKKNRLHAS